ncbi:MAG: glycosyltransferase [Saprospiraceae bacterium]
MTILLIANTAWNIWHSRTALIGDLAMRGHRVVSAGAVDSSVPQIRAAGIDFRPLRCLDPGNLRPDRELRTLGEIYQLLRIVRPDRVLLYTPKIVLLAGLAARLALVPRVAVITGQGYAALHGGWVNRRLVPLLYRLSLGGSRAVVCYNRADLDYFHERGVPRDRLHLIPGSGVDTDYFSPLPYPAAGANELRLLYIGRLLYDKGLRELAAALRLLKKEGHAIECTLLGQLAPPNPAAVPATELEQWIAEGLVIHRPPADDIRPFLARTHALVLPSYREGIPRAALEAMAAARPLIMSDAPGCGELVEESKNGFTARVRDAESLAEAIRKFSRLDQKKRTALGEASRRMVEQGYGLEEINRRLIAVIEA